MTRELTMTFPTQLAAQHPLCSLVDADCPPPIVSKSDPQFVSDPAVVACSGCGAALSVPRCASVDYRDALCGRFLDSTHRVLDV
jgi:hypothetical protein